MTFDFMHPSGVLIALAAALAILAAAYVLRRRLIVADDGEAATTRMMPRRTERARADDAELATDRSQRTTAPKYPPPPLAARLTCAIEGAFAKDYSLAGANVVRIGREDDNDITIPHPTVHRYHAMIQRSSEAGYTISDLSSDRGNGVLLNGRRVTHARLDNGDIIGLGKIELNFNFDEGGALGAAADT